MTPRFTAPKEQEHTLTSHHPLLSRLLVNRDIITEEEAQRYLRPEYDTHMHDPFLLPDMDKALLRIFSAIEKNEKIVVYADYDCDGIPGAVILHDLFSKIKYKNVSFYIPDRHTEGYGLHKDAIETFITDEVSLIITIDLGTSDHEQVAYATANGIDVIVTDHHLPHETLPPAYAIINPKIGEYPEKMLCGAGVVFKLLQGFVKKYGEYFEIHEGWEKWSLDMAGLGTLSDMVPLTGENRVIAYYGMHVMRKTKRPGLIQLFRLLKLNQTHLAEDDLTFMVTPRINAASRMASPMRAFEMLAETDPVQAGMYAKELSSINDDRKHLVARIMKEAHATLSEREIQDVLVIGNPNWRIGVLGLVAGKISDQYNVPVFVWGREGSNDEHTVKGSCRSNGSVNVVSLMHSQSELFLEYGGHELAGGFSLKTEDVFFLEEKLQESYTSGEGMELAHPEQEIDGELTLSDVSESTYKMINACAPFGLGNTKPHFMFPQVVAKHIKLFGKGKDHLEVIFTDKNGTTQTAIAFFSGTDSFTKKVEEGETYNLIATIEKSYFMNRPTLRLRIVDIQ